MAHMEDLKKIVGSGTVSDDEETLDLYSKDQSLLSLSMPDCVVKPGSAKEVQAVISWANETLTPLTPVSSPGGPRFHGDTIPERGVVVDLSGMNNILSVDRRDRVAIVEPGVTFDQLETALKKQGLRAYKPLLPRQSKSVIGSMLEREPVTTPCTHMDAQEPLVCMEVVFGTGDVFRTGSAAGALTLAQQLKAGVKQVTPVGPGGASLSRVVQGAQGTMGIVTWASLYCGILPELKTCQFATSQNLGPIVELAYGILRQRIGEDLFIVNGFQLATMMAGNANEVQSLADELPPWVLVCNITGSGDYPEDQLDYQLADARDLAETVNLDLTDGVGSATGKDLLSLLEEPPQEYYKARFKGSAQDIFFITTLDRTPTMVKAMDDILDENNIPTSEVGVYIQPRVQGTSCHVEFIIPHNPESKTETNKLKALIPDSCRRLIENGAFFNRPYYPWAKMAFEKDPVSVSALRKVKKIFDPKGIMNPGKLVF